MDTSEEYLNMCIQLPEIQKNNMKWTIGSVFFCETFEGCKNDYNRKTFGVCVSNRLKSIILEDTKDITERLYDYDLEYSTRDKCTYWKATWLPLQNQLQDMLTTHLNRESHGVLYDFIDWMEDLSTEDTRGHRDYSIEQLWLAFVMHEVYRKTWNSKDWVVE